MLKIGNWPWFALKRKCRQRSAEWSGRADGPAWQTNPTCRTPTLSSTRSRGWETSFLSMGSGWRPETPHWVVTSSQRWRKQQLDLIYVKNSAGYVTERRKYSLRHNSPSYKWKMTFTWFLHRGPPWCPTWPLCCLTRMSGKRPTLSTQTTSWMKRESSKGGKHFYLSPQVIRMFCTWLYSCH